MFDAVAAVYLQKKKFKLKAVGYKLKNTTIQFLIKENHNV